MSKVSRLGQLPKEHPNLSNEEERNENMLIRAEDENREFTEEAARIAQDVTFLQSGVNEQVANTLTSRPGLPLNALQQRTLEERVQAQLYRAVQGNEIAETERGEDSRNYQDSSNVVHMRTGLPGRAGNHLLNVVRGAGTMIGTNNTIEAAVNRRFGGNRDVQARRNFVGNRLLVPLNMVANGNPALFGTIVLFLNANYGAGIAVPGGGLIPPATVNQVSAALSNMTLLQIRDFRNWARGNGLPGLANGQAFRDLYLLVDVAQRESAKFGIAEVYDTTRLRQFWDNTIPGAVSLAGTLVIPPGGGAPQPFTEVLNGILEQNSLFPLEENPEGTAFLAELRNRIMNQAVMANIAGGAIPPQVFQTVMNDIQQVAAAEVPEGQLTDADRQRFTTCRTEINPILTECSATTANVTALSRRVDALDTNIRNLNLALYNAELDQEQATADRIDDLDDEIDDLENTAIANVDTQIANLNTLLAATPPNAQRNILQQIAAAEKRRDTLVHQLSQLQQERTRLQVEPVASQTVTGLRSAIQNLQTQIDQQQTALQTAIDSLRTQGGRMADILRNSNLMQQVNNPALVAQVNVNGVVRNIFDVLADPAVNVPRVINGIANSLGQLQTNFINRLEQVGRPPVRLTPFQLLQRLMRRDYLRENNLPTDLYNEEANRYALIKAALRVEDVKSIDIRRTANNQAAEVLNRGLLARGYDKLKYAVAKGQDMIGLEPIEFREITADKMLEQLINSREEFHVFRGINKFTTTRDLRRILIQSGKTVPRDTMERFVQTLEDSISEFKKTRPELAVGLDPDDWDLENLLEVFKKLKVELWARQFLDNVEAAGGTENREHTLVRMLRGSRQQEREVEKQIREGVKHMDATWRLQLAKSELKRVLDPDTLAGTNKLKQAGLEIKKADIARLETEMNALPENDPGRLALAREIESIRNNISQVEKQIREAVTLYDRVEAAKKYLDENDLSRRQRREYLEAVGLTQVFDKMSTNFKLQKTWKYTKKGAAYMWAGTKKGWAWSRRKFLNAKTAKSAAEKTFSVGRLLATPVTAPLDWGWRGTTFVGSMVGRAMGRTIESPLWLGGQMNSKLRRRYYRMRIIDETERLDALLAKRNRLKAKVNYGPYSWDKKRIAKRMNRLEEKIYNQNTRINAIRKSAADKQVNLGEMATYTEVANDNGEIVINKAA